MADIFISYKRQEAEHAELLANTLEQLGFSVWWDNALLSGDQFRNVIKEIIDKSTLVIVLWSPLAIQSQFVIDEATLAQQQDKLLPTFLSACELPFGFGSQHADDLSGWDGSLNHSGFSRLLKSIEKQVGKTARLGSNLGSTPSQKAEMNAFQTVAKLNSEGAWLKFLEDYPATTFRKFIESHMGTKNPLPHDSEENSSISKAPASRPTQAKPETPKPDVKGKRKSLFPILASVAGLAVLGVSGVVWSLNTTDRAADDAAWNLATTQNDITLYTTYLSTYPNGAHTNDARQKITALETAIDDAVWEKARAANSITSYTKYLNTYPNGLHADAAKKAKAGRLKVKKRSQEKSIKFNGRDCPDCPQMVRIPVGKFMMGSIDGKNDEKPVRTVSILKSFSVGKYEVTFDEWDACVKDGGCKHRPYDKGWGRGTRPVINVSWNDTQLYMKWLSEKTGKTYRLLTEAEWEYVARAGTKTTFPWGNEISHENANYGTESCCSGKVEGRDKWKNTAPVGSFNANQFGLHDMQGNVWEWVEDCWVGNYEGLDNTPRARAKSQCTSRTLRGGSWDSRMQSLRSANRNNRSQSRRTYYYGFRVAKTN